jgi:hypothetical protein
LEQPLERPRLFFWFDCASDYDTVRAVIRDEPELPVLYDDWLEATQKRIAELLASETCCQKVVIKAEHFAAWCRGSGVEQNLATLGAYTIAIASKREAA